jgi:distribution and morphology protein 10
MGIPEIFNKPIDRSPSAANIEEDEEAEGDSVVKVRVDQSWNVRVLWEGRVKSLLVTAGVSLGPGTFSSLASGPSSPTLESSSSPTLAAESSQSAGGGAAPSSKPSYWRGVGVSVLYSS